MITIIPFHSFTSDILVGHTNLFTWNIKRILY